MTIPILPKIISDSDLTFGSRIDHLIPAMEIIPKEFHMCSNNKWVHIVETWFFKGLPKETQFIPADGIDKTQAMRHVNCVMRSWKPKHEHKTAACAYLLSLWFKDIIIPTVTTTA